MRKTICDNCKKGINIRDAHAGISFSKIKESILESFDVCEKCISYIPKLLKDIQIKKA